MLDGLLQLAERIVGGQHPRQGEEAGLHHRVDAAAQAGGASNCCGVDGEQLHLPGHHLLLHLTGQAVPHLVGGVRRVEEHRGTARGE